MLATFLQPLEEHISDALTNESKSQGSFKPYIFDGLCHAAHWSGHAKGEPTRLGSGQDRAGTAAQGLPRPDSQHSVPFN